MIQTTTKIQKTFSGSVLSKYACLLLVSITGLTLEAQDENRSKALTFGGAYTGDIVGNLRGGIKPGAAYLGMVSLQLDLDTETAGWWSGGEAYVKLANTHGDEPSANLVGDFQGVSNIEAGNLTWIYELWYRQTLGALDITIGLQDLNATFASSEGGILFTNSSFGVHSSIADNISSPIFPITALGLNTNWQISDKYNLRLALFDGVPDKIENNPAGIHWRLSKQDGYLLVTEFQAGYSLLRNNSGNYKLGLYYHRHTNELGTMERNYGFYFVGDQTLTKKLSAFSQIGLSPRSINDHSHYYALGFRLSDFIKKRNADQLGLAVAYAGIDNNIVGSETAIELIYNFQLNSNIFIRPDIQYVINPAGTGQKLSNALVAFLRVGLEF